MFGKKITKLIENNDKKERLQFQVALIVTIAVTLLYTMFAFGLNDITNESLSKNDMQQLQGILSSVIVISVVAIIFFQWILSTQLQNILDIRQQFTDSLLLMGLPRFEITKLYVYELVRMYFLSVIIGFSIGSISYVMIANMLQLDEKLVPLNIYIIAFFISIVLNFYIVGIDLFKALKGNIIDKIRNRNGYIAFTNISIKGILIRIFLVVILILISHHIRETSNIRQIFELSKVLNIVAIMVMFNPIARGIYTLLYNLFKKMNLNNFFLAMKIAKGYFSQVKVTCMFIILSCTIFVGLNSLFNMVRVAGKNVADKNIRYRYLGKRYNFYQDKSKSDKNKYFGIKVKAKTDSGSNIYISGIDKLYLNNFEEIHAIKESKNALNNILENKSNAIFIPEVFASSRDIGKNVKITINRKSYEFKVAGLYYSNNFGELNCFVNKAYLKEILNIDENEHNVVFLKNYNVTKYDEIIPKSDIVNQSRDRAVKGTSIVETITYLLLVCAVVSLFIYYSLITKNNERDILRFRAMGIGYNKILSIYILHSIVPILISGIFLIPITKMFTYVCLYVTLSSYYFRKVSYTGIYLEIGILLIFMLISIVIQLFYIIKLKKRSDFITQLRYSI